MPTLPLMKLHNELIQQTKVTRSDNDYKDNSKIRKNNMESLPRLLPHSLLSFTKHLAEKYGVWHERQQSNHLEIT